MKFSSAEIRDLFKAWLAISLAFAIMFSGGISGIISPAFLLLFAFSAVTAGVGFVFHEIAHKIAAHRYGCWAEFRSYDRMLALAILFSFFGFIFAAPGGVLIKGRITEERNGKISAAGIIANIIVAAVFAALFFASESQLLSAVGAYGLHINSLLALFNMIPFLGFDGLKVWRWSRPAYLIIACIAAFMMIMANGLVLR